MLSQAVIQKHGVLTRKTANTLFTRPFVGKKLEMKHNWYSKIAVAAIALVTSLVQVVRVSPVKATTPVASVPNIICKQVKQNVSLAKGQPATHKVVGELCYKPNHKNTVHLLLSGATYGHLYWDFPLDPKRYS